jgi:hypothetical protein
MAMDNRASETVALLTALVDEEQRQGVFVSIASARLAYLEHLASGLVQSVKRADEFGRLFVLFVELLDLVLERSDNGELDRDVSKSLEILHRS